MKKQKQHFITSGTKKKFNCFIISFGASWQVMETKVWHYCPGISHYLDYYCTAQKMKFSIMDIFDKCDQIRSFLGIWSHLLKKSLMENFIFCAVLLYLSSLEAYFKTSRTSTMELSCENSQWLKDVNYFRKKLHRRCATGF